MAYNPAQWDSYSINNDDIYSLLQRANPQSNLTLDPTRFPAPAVDNPTPPASEESSPSPPSIKEREEFAARATRRALYGEDDHAKRKQDDISDSDDSSYEQPSKHQHRSSDRDGSGGGPRRSSGGTKKKSGNPDENRALKRKEQNRAAQRAFRERKERHVKELEDQVAALEAKSANQDRENENLRDLLGRLQNENLLLKQSAFTFSFPPGGNNASPSTDAPQSSINAGLNRRPASPKLASPSSSSSASTPENTTDEIPESTLFARPNTSRPSVNSTSSASSGSSPRSEATTSRFLSSPGAFGLGGGSHLPEYNNNNSNGLDFFGSGQDLNLLGGKTNTVNGITTIAANPMYMSFGDPVLDPMAWASFGPGDYATGASTSPPGIGGNSSADMDIFGMTSFGNGGAINVAAPPSHGSGNTVNATGANGYTSIDDIFGTASTGSGVTPSFLDFGGAVSMTGSHSTASSSTGGATFSSSSPSAIGSLSDVPAHDDGTSDTCPKTIEDVQRLQQGASPSTFGPAVPLPKSNASSPNSGSSPSAGGGNSVLRGETNGEACAHARMAALCADLPRTTKKPNQIEIGRAWEKIRQHQGFEECDIDELCNELSAKARCDGSRPVLEEASFNNIVQSLGAMHKKRSNSGGVGAGAGMMPAAQAMASA